MGKVASRFRRITSFAGGLFHIHVVVVDFPVAT
jgi:hypothetical protein